MTQHYEAHANRIVDAFKGLLGEEAAAQIGDEHYDELSMMIESALSSSVIEELEHAADKIAELAANVRKHAEHYD
jgi:predicted Co/Zn/Cd cation transporter (cation efflux family)